MLTNNDDENIRPRNEKNAMVSHLYQNESFAIGQTPVIRNKNTCDRKPGGTYSFTNAVYTLTLMRSNHGNDCIACEMLEWFEWCGHSVGSMAYGSLMHAMQLATEIFMPFANCELCNAQQNPLERRIHIFDDIYSRKFGVFNNSFNSNMYFDMVIRSKCYARSPKILIANARQCLKRWNN